MLSFTFALFIVHHATLTYAQLQTPISSHSNTRFLTFELRQLHGLTPEDRIPVFKDVSVSSFTGSTSLSARTAPLVSYKPRSLDAFHAARLHPDQPPIDWDPTETLGPDVTDIETLTALAKMTSNAYYEHGPQSGWYDLEGWNTSYPVGWEPDADGFRGHVFATPDNSTIVLSIKGTSLLFQGPSSRKDKLNDNLMFSCCCARVATWTPVCGCYAGSGKCNQSCLEDSLAEKSLFYSVGVNLYNNITYMYPSATIWVVGHSLGGALSSLIGTTFGAPVVAFEAPGERLAAQRLHIPTPPSLSHVTHVYNTADPVPMGTCNGAWSACQNAGFAFETRCHLGKSIVFDTVTELGWSVSVLTAHAISAVIDKILTKRDWSWVNVTGSFVPEAKAEEDCYDCYAWEFGEFPPKLGSGMC